MSDLKREPQKIFGEGLNIEGEGSVCACMCSHVHKKAGVILNGHI